MTSVKLGAIHLMGLIRDAHVQLRNDYTHAPGPIWREVLLFLIGSAAVGTILGIVVAFSGLVVPAL